MRNFSDNHKLGSDMSKWPSIERVNIGVEATTSAIGLFGSSGGRPGKYPENRLLDENRLKRK